MCFGRHLHLNNPLESQYEGGWHAGVQSQKWPVEWAVIQLAINLQYEGSSYLYWYTTQTHIGGQKHVTKINIANQQIDHKILSALQNVLKMKMQKTKIKFKKIHMKRGKIQVLNSNNIEGIKHVEQKGHQRQNGALLPFQCITPYCQAAQVSATPHCILCLWG